MSISVKTKDKILKKQCPSGNELLYGYGFGLSFCIVIALSSIFIHQTTQSVSPMLSVFLTFVICTLWFNILNVKSICLFYRNLLKDRKNFLLVNTATAINWIATFVALKYTSPILYISMFVGMLPISTYLIMLLQKKEKFQFKIIFTSILITSILLAITLVEKEYISNTEEQNFYMGIMFTAISSIASALYMIYSKQLSIVAGLSPSQVVAVRFHILIISTGIICFINNHFSQIGNVHFSNFIIMAFLSSILPMYLLQKTIHLLGALKTSFISPFTPIFTYLALLFSEQSTPFLLLPLVIGLTTILFYHAYFAVTKKI